MIERRMLAGLVLGLLLFGLSSAPVPAAQLLLGGPGGTTDEPDPTPDPPDGGEPQPDDADGDGTQAQGGWNPTITCPAEGNDTIWDILACLDYGFENPTPVCLDTDVDDLWDGGYDGQQGHMDVAEAGPSGDDCEHPMAAEDFLVDLLPWPYFGINVVRRDDGGEPHRIWVKENNPGIQTTELRLDQPRRVARIHVIDEAPVPLLDEDSVGSLFITINDRTVEIPTERYVTAEDLNGAIVDSLKRANFDVWRRGMFIVVEFDYNIRDTPRQLRFRSTDADIKKSDIGLVPLDEVFGFAIAATSK